MNCQQAHELLPLYVDDELEVGRKEAVERHLAGCAECRRRLALDRQLTLELQKIGSEKMSPAPPDLRGRVMDKVEQQQSWKLWWQAAGLVARTAVMLGVTLAFGLLIYYLAVQGRQLNEPQAAARQASPVGAASEAQVSETAAAPSSPRDRPRLSGAETEPTSAIPSTVGPVATAGSGPLKPTPTPLPAALPVATEEATSVPTPMMVYLTPTVLSVPQPSASAAPGTPATAVLPLLSLHMVDSRAGWALTQGAVLRTLDGGATWSDVTPVEARQEAPGGALVPVVTGSTFLDAKAARVAFGSADGKLMTVYRTRDGGRTWSQSSVAGLGGQITFIDAQYGWIEASQGIGAGSEGVDIYRTTNGGADWEMVSRTAFEADSTPGSLPLSGNKGGLAFRDALMGWTVVSIPMEARPGLYVTRNGGRTWQEQTIEIPPDLQRAWATAELPRFFNNREGILPVRFSLDMTQVLIFYATTDGGETWSPTASLKEAQVFDFVSPQRGWVATAPENGGVVMHTTDGGRSWQAVASGFSAGSELRQIAQLDFVDEMNGWALLRGEQGPSLIRTTDGGKTWRPAADSGGAIPAYPLATPALPPDVLPCATDDLSAIVAWQDDAGSLAGSLVVTNVGETTCAIEELPLVFALLDGRGQRLPIEVSVAPGDTHLSAPVMLRPGEQISERLVWRNWCGGPVQAPLTMQVVQKGSAGTAIADVGDPAAGNQAMTPRCDVPGSPSTLVVGPMPSAELQ